MISLNDTQKSVIMGIISPWVESIIDTSFKSHKQYETKEAINFAYKLLLKPYATPYQELCQEMNQLEQENVYNYKGNRAFRLYSYLTGIKRPKYYENILSITKPLKDLASICEVTEDMYKKLTIYKCGKMCTKEDIMNMDKNLVMKYLEEIDIKVNIDNFDEKISSLNSNMLDRLGEKINYPDYKDAAQKFTSDVLGQFLKDFYILTQTKGRTPKELKEKLSEIVTKLDFSLDNKYDGLSQNIERSR